MDFPSISELRAMPNTMPTMIVSNNSAITTSRRVNPDRRELAGFPVMAGTCGRSARFPRAGPAMLPLAYQRASISMRYISCKTLPSSFSISSIGSMVVCSSMPVSPTWVSVSPSSSTGRESVSSSALSRMRVMRSSLWASRAVFDIRCRATTNPVVAMRKHRQREDHLKEKEPALAAVGGDRSLDFVVGFRGSRR